MVSDVTLTGAANNTSKTQNAGLKLAEDFSQFLTLLTTQLQNQDPLNPMDSKEFTTQLVQFSQVEQSINTNQKLDDLVSLQLGSASAVGLGYVGLDVMYRSADMNFDGTKPVKINYALSKQAFTSNINIYDEKDKLVFSKQVEGSVGNHEFVWDGKDSLGQPLAAGTYSVTVAALDADDQPIENTTVVSGHVRGIETQNGVLHLLIGDRAVPLGQVINATVPEETATAPDTTGDGGDTEEEGA